MKQIQFSQFDPVRLFTYVLSRLVESHEVEVDRSKERISPGEAGPWAGARVPPRLAAVLKTFSRPRGGGGHRAITKSAE